MARSRKLRRAIAFAAVAALTIAVASAPTTPAAAAAVRYVDTMFTSSMTSDLVYTTSLNSSGVQQDLHLDLYQPVGDTETERPVVIWVHGGSFMTGNKTDMAAFADGFAQRGYVTATIQYRLRPQLATDGTQIVAAMYDAGRDLQAAVRWFRANAATYGIDPDRITVAGASAGAITAMFATFLPELAEPAPGDTFSSDVAAGGSFAGFWFEGAAEPWSPPILMGHGTADTTVPLSWATPLCTSTVADGNVCDLHTYPTGHEGLLAYSTELTDLWVQFLYDHVITGGDRCGDAFEDVSGTHPFCAEIERVAHRGIVGGYSDHTFRSTVTVSRQALVAWLYRMAGSPAGPFADPGFTDVPTGYVFETEIRWAAETGLVNGYADGTFKPTAGLTRQAAAAILHRAEGNAAATCPTPTFADVGLAHPFYVDICWLDQNGLANHPADNRFRPGNAVSRQAAASWLSKVLDLPA